MAFLQRLKIGTRLAFAFVAVFLAVIGLGLYNLYNFKTVADADTQLYEDGTLGVAQINDLNSAVAGYRLGLWRLFVMETPAEIEKGIAALTPFQTQALQASKSTAQQSTMKKTADSLKPLKPPMIAI